MKQPLKERMKIAVVIPSFIDDLQNLGKTLETISQQTRCPELVVVHISSIPSETILESFESVEYPFRFQIFSVPEKRSAAENRNAGATKVPEEFDVICFFDSDDWMHPNRTEYIERAFEESVDVVLHSIIRDRPDTFTGWEPVDYRLYTDCCYMKPNTARCYIAIDGDEKQHASGHVSIRRSVAEDILFPSSKATLGGEDTLYLTHLYHSGYRFGYLLSKLSVYIQR